MIMWRSEALALLQFDIMCAHYPAVPFLADVDAFVAIARSLADQTFVRCTLVELHSAKVCASPTCWLLFSNQAQMDHAPYSCTG